MWFWNLLGNILGYILVISFFLFVIFSFFGWIGNKIRGDYITQEENFGFIISIISILLIVYFTLIA